MPSSLRSFIQFAPLERKLRQLSQQEPDWKSRIKAIATVSLIEFEVARARLCYSAAPDPSRVRDCLTLVTTLAKPAGEVGQAELQQFQALLEPNVPGQQPCLRTGEAPRICAGHEPLDAAVVPRALARFFEWTSSNAFAEMHPVEQMTLCQVRLCEIWPFAVSAGVAADFFALLILYQRTGLLPLFAPDESQVFRDALCEGFRFVTKPLVDFHLRGCERACDEMLRLQ